MKMYLTHFSALVFTCMLSEWFLPRRLLFVVLVFALLVEVLLFKHINVFTAFRMGGPGCGVGC